MNLREGIRRHLLGLDKATYDALVEALNAYANANALTEGPPILSGQEPSVRALQKRIDAVRTSTSATLGELRAKKLPPTVNVNVSTAVSVAQLERALRKKKLS